jgi:hypothetical protein
VSEVFTTGEHLALVASTVPTGRSNGSQGDVFTADESGYDEETWPMLKEPGFSLHGVR